MPCILAPYWGIFGLLTKCYVFNFALEYAIRRVQVNQDGLKVNGTHQLLAYADNVNILGGSIHTLKENAEALVAATTEMDWK